MDVNKEYILFCDESDREGRYYSNFYGGALVGSSQYERVTTRLNELKARLHLHHEVKWKRVTAQYLDKYQELMRAFFEEVAGGHIKVRIMFRQNAHVPVGLTDEQLAWQYYLLYYQFIKHAFGLKYAPSRLRLRLYFDTFPDTAEKVTQFKGFLLGLTKLIDIQPQDITEVDSKDHVILQCLDIVLGAVAFRLNDKHKEKMPGSRRRGKRTIAKEKLYKTILAEVQKIRPRFNIGVSTAVSQLSDRWEYPYMHWAFVPKRKRFDGTLTKAHRRTNKKPPSDLREVSGA